MKLTKQITDKYEEAAYKERLAFKEFIKTFKYSNNELYEIVYTEYTGSDVYDVLIVNRLTRKRAIIEIKIRGDEGTHRGIQDGFFLEKKKYNSLLKLRKYEILSNEDDCKIFYLNFTTSGTYMWNLDSILIKSVRMTMNKATMGSKIDKVDKEVFTLKVEDAKHHSYQWIDRKYWDDTPPEAKKIKGIFD